MQRMLLYSIFIKSSAELENKIPRVGGWVDAPSGELKNKGLWVSLALYLLEAKNL